MLTDHAAAVLKPLLAMVAYVAAMSLMLLGALTTFPALLFALGLLCSALVTLLIAGRSSVLGLHGRLLLAVLGGGQAIVAVMYHVFLSFPIVR